METPYPRTPHDRPVAPLTCRPPVRAPLEGRWVRLEPQEAEAHGAELFTAGQEAAIWDYLAYGPFARLEDHAAVIEAQAASSDPLFFAIRPLDGPAMGQASFLEIAPERGAIEIGHIWFGPQLQRTRGATEALYLMLRTA
ncbi:MAG: hypothetical protein AAFW69_03240, partial [Pseudomonadota bacterium]